MKDLRCLLLLPLILITALTSAQKKVITGKVIDKATGQPLGGATILVDKAKTGIATKDDGTYTISISQAKSILVFSYLGYITQIIPVDSKAVINVSLVQSTAVTESEVVVIGYGTQKRNAVTGAVTKYKNERIDETATGNLDQALQGKMAGVQVQQTTSEAGASTKINIRGVTSVNAGGNPLIVVDGQPLPDGTALTTLNMSDVESIEVLKDAASSAIYGSRGASGVILITTKSGVAEKARYNFKYSIGQKRDYKRYDIMTSSDYVRMLFAENTLRLTDPTATQLTIAEGDRAAYVIEQKFRNGQSTDWQSESLKPGTFQNVSLSVSGGKKEIKYFISAGVTKDEGIQFKSNFEKFNLRAKVDVELSKKAKLTINLNPSYSKKESPSENFTNFFRYPSWLPVYHNDLTAAAVNSNAQWAAIRPGDFAQPRHFSKSSTDNLVYGGIMPDGSTWVPKATATTTLDVFSSAQNNPKSSVLMQNINTSDYRLQASADFGYDILSGLKFKSLVSTYITYTNGLSFANRNATADGVVNKGVYTNNSTIDLLSENTLTYNKRFKDHSLNLLAGFTAQKTNLNKSQTTGLDYPSDAINTLNYASQIDKNGTFGTKNQIGLLSYLGRINYSFKDKYLISASIRTDGSSYFADGRKWATFPAVSVGWVASEEKFLKKVDWIDRLKFRASYGTTGNNRIADFAFLDLLFPTNYSFGTGTGLSNSGLSGSTTILANPDVTWESTFQTNLGMDLSLLKNRVNLTVDVYQSKTDRLLIQQNTMAFTGVPIYWNNNGSLQNRGIEIDLSTKNISTRNFTWSTTFNISHNENKVLSFINGATLLNQGERTEIYQNKVGDPLVQYFGYKTDGVWLSAAQIADAQSKGLTTNLSSMFIAGGLKLVDVNGDNVIDTKDRVVLGNPYPNFTWGMSNTIKFKAIDVTVNMQGVSGGKLINGDPNYNEVKRSVRAYNTNRWVSAANPGDGKTPYGTNGFSWLLTDYVVEDASYFALRDIIVGFTVPSKTIKKTGLSSARFYFSMQNFYIKGGSNYRGINPEARFNNGPYSSNLLDGYQRGGFPMNKSYLVGIDINF